MRLESYEQRRKPVTKKYQNSWEKRKNETQYTDKDYIMDSTQLHDYLMTLKNKSAQDPDIQEKKR